MDKLSFGGLFSAGKRLFFGVVVVGAAGMAWAQGADTAYVPFIVNVDATVKAERGGNVVSMNVTANTVDTLKIPLETPTSVTHRSQNAQNNVPAITSNRGRVSINLPGQNYRAAEISLYSINGRRILRTNASATEAAKSISRPNLVAGVYLLTVKGANGHSFTNRLTHSGGGLNISVLFGNENFASASPAVAALSRQAAADEPEEWAISISADRFLDSTYTLDAVEKKGSLQNITLKPDGPHFNPNVRYGSFRDDRDGQVYRTVQIGNQVWMAENLNWAGTSSNLGWCYADNLDNCEIYGRLYNWSTVMALPPVCNEAECVDTDVVLDKHRGICPAGWHVPTDAQWITLTAFVGYTSAGRQLRAMTGWEPFVGDTPIINGTNDYGFSALPGGFRTNSGAFATAGINGIWWSATEEDAAHAWHRGMDPRSNFFHKSQSAATKDINISLRCVKD